MKTVEIDIKKSLGLSAGQLASLRKKIEEKFGGSWTLTNTSARGKGLPGSVLFDERQFIQEVNDFLEELDRVAAASVELGPLVST